MIAKWRPPQRPRAVSAPCPRRASASGAGLSAPLQELAERDDGASGAPLRAPPRQRPHREQAPRARTRRAAWLPQPDRRRGPPRTLALDTHDQTLAHVSHLPVFPPQYRGFVGCHATAARVRGLSGVVACAPPWRRGTGSEADAAPFDREHAHGSSPADGSDPSRRPPDHRSSGARRGDANAQNAPSTRPGGEDEKRTMAGSRLRPPLRSSGTHGGGIRIPRHL